MYYTHLCLPVYILTTIFTRFVRQFTDVIIKSGNSCEFIVEVTGNPKPKVNTRFNVALSPISDQVLDISP